MSTGANCQFVERRKNEWYYKIQRWPYGETTEYDEEGPFATLRAAEKHLDQNYPNPGGSFVQYHNNEIELRD